MMNVMKNSKMTKSWMTRSCCWMMTSLKRTRKRSWRTRNCCCLMMSLMMMNCHSKKDGVKVCIECAPCG